MLGSRKGKSVGGRSAFLSRTLDRSSPIYKALTNDLYGPWEPPATRQDRLCRESALCTPSHVANRACACRRSIPVPAQGVCTVRGIPSRHQCLADNSKLLTLGSSAGTEQTTCAPSARVLAGFWLTRYLSHQRSLHTISSNKKCSYHLNTASQFISIYLMCFLLLALIHCGSCGCVPIVYDEFLWWLVQSLLLLKCDC